MALLLTLFFCALTLFGQVFYLFQSDAPLIELVLGSLPTFGAALLLCGTYAMLGRLGYGWLTRIAQAVLVGAAFVAMVMTLVASIGYWQMSAVPRLQQFGGLTWNIIAPSVMVLITTHGTALILALVSIILVLALLWAIIHHSQGLRWKLAPIWLAGVALLVASAFASRSKLNQEPWFLASKLLRTDLDSSALLSESARHAETRFFRKYHEKLSETEEAPRYPDIYNLLRGSNVIWVVMESMRAKDVPLYGGTADMPHTIQASKHMLLLKNLYSQDPRSTKAYAQMDMGRFSLLSWDSYSNNIPWMFPDEGLASHLARMGYSTATLVNGDGNYDNHQFFQEQHGYQTVLYRQALNPGSSGADDLKLLEKAKEEVAGLRKPFYMMIWPIQTHHPYGREHWSGHGKKTHTDHQETPKFGQADYARYLASLQQADDWFGRLLAMLESKGLIDQTTIIVTGDHGEAFREHESGNVFHGNGVYEESVHIPGFIYSTKINGLHEDERYMRLLDIPATILHMASEEHYILNDGRSIFKNYKNTIPIYLFNSWVGAIGIIHEGNKFWRRTYFHDQMFSASMESIRKDPAKERQHTTAEENTDLQELLNEWETAMMTRSARLLNQNAAGNPPLHDIIRIYCDDGNGFREERKSLASFSGLSGEVVIKIDSGCRALRLAPIHNTVIPENTRLKFDINDLKITGSDASWTLKDAKLIFQNDVEILNGDDFYITGQHPYLDYEFDIKNHHLENVSMKLEYAWEHTEKK